MNLFEYRPVCPGDASGYLYDADIIRKLSKDFTMSNPSRFSLDCVYCCPVPDGVFFLATNQFMLAVYYSAESRLDKPCCLPPGFKPSGKVTVSAERYFEYQAKDGPVRAPQFCLKWPERKTIMTMLDWLDNSPGSHPGGPWSVSLELLTPFQKKSKEDGFTCLTVDTRKDHLKVDTDYGLKGIVMMRR